MRTRPTPRLRGALALLVAVGITTSVLLPGSLSESAHADSVRDRQYWLDDLGITAAWSVTRGEGIVIAILDSGVDAGHPDLEGVVIGGTDVSGRGSPAGTEPLGPQGRTHATMVASLAAGRGNAPGNGVIGAAPAASILSVSLAFGPGERNGDAQIAEGVIWAVDNGADIISLSLTRNQISWPENWDEAFLYAEKNDVVVIAAAGNRGNGTEQVAAPATMPGVIAVGGVDRAGRASTGASTEGITIAVMAPSEGLVGAVPGGGYSSWQGTSGATPIVAGIAALVRAAHPDLDAAEVVNRIVSTARPVTSVVPDPDYGYGIIDAAAAVSASVPLAGANPLGSLAEWIAINRRAEAEPLVIELAEPREPRARAIEPPPTLVPTWVVREARASIPLVGIVIATGTALAALIAVAAVQFVTRRRSE